MKKDEYTQSIYAFGSINCLRDRDLMPETVCEGEGGGFQERDALLFICNSLVRW